MRKLLKAFGLLLLASAAHASGDLALSPVHDFAQGWGSRSILSIDEEIPGYSKIHLLPTITMVNVQGYRDYNGSLDMQYQWTERFATVVGYTYDSYLHYGEDVLQSGELHGGVKVKLW